MFLDDVVLMFVENVVVVMVVGLIMVCLVDYVCQSMIWVFEYFVVVCDFDCLEGFMVLIGVEVKIFDVIGVFDILVLLQGIDWIFIVDYQFFGVDGLFGFFVV